MHSGQSWFKVQPSTWKFEASLFRALEVTLSTSAVRRELRGLRLGCWCEQPGPCHGHNLCEVADADIDDDADDTAL